MPELPEVEVVRRGLAPAVTGARVVGISVEDPRAAAALWSSGVDYLQGNLVQEPEVALDFDFRHPVL